MSIPRITFILIELLLLTIFIIPVFLNIVNAGNIAGILVSLLLLGATVFWRQLFAFLQNMWAHTSGKLLLSIIAVLLAACIGFAGFLTVRMISTANNAPEQPCTVVVLGCHVKGTKPSLMLARRLDTAYEYMLEHPEVKCVVTGGQGTGEDITEAEAMKNYLVEKGIASERILEEDKSTNTLENLTFSKDILEENGVSGDIVIVTDNFHQYRASLIAEKLGLDSYSISCTTRIELVPTYWVREWFALAKEILLT